MTPTVPFSQAQDLCAQIAGWRETAAQAYRNVDYYRGLVVQIGDMFGEAAHLADDGSRSEDVLCAKVPQLVAALRAEVERLRTTLDVVNEIRNSIIGTQTINWSEHVYPLVAALNAAGIIGLDYPEGKVRYGTMLERTLAAEADVQTLAEALEDIRDFAKGRASFYEIFICATDALARPGVMRVREEGSL